MERLLNSDNKCNINEYSPLTLAFIGDGVFELFVREQLVSNGNKSVKSLNIEKINLVCCKAQAEFAKTIIPILTEEELSVYKRGRNAHTSTVPKNASKADYHSATGIEALFGYLYLCGKIDRIRELFKNIHQKE